MRWVPSVAASILPSHVHNQRFRALRLDFKGGDERIFGVDDHMFGFALQLESDCELQRGTPNSLQYTTVAQRQPRPDEAVRKGAGSVKSGMGLKAGVQAMSALRTLYPRYRTIMWVGETGRSGPKPEVGIVRQEAGVVNYVFY